MCIWCVCVCVCVCGSELFDLNNTIRSHWAIVMAEWQDVVVVNTRMIDSTSL